MTAVSVIVPTHNSKKYIKECMDSIVRQTMKNIEIICVDSSTDGTTDILYTYKKHDNRIQVIEDANTSYGHKINVGLHKAEGDYIAIVESDDYIKDNMMESLYQAAGQNKVDVIKSNYESFIDIEGERIYVSSEIVGEEYYHRVIKLKEEKTVLPLVGYHIWTGIYRTNFLKENSIYFHESAGASYQDTGFAALTAMMAERIYFLKETFYRYRRDNDGSSVKSDQKYMCIPQEFVWLRERMKQLGCETPENIELFKILKLRSYYWNYRRLSEAYREKLLNEVQEDKLEDCDGSIINFNMPDKEYILRIYRGDRECIEQERAYNKKMRMIYENLLYIFRSYDNIVLVCYGRYGQSVHRLMKLVGYTGNLLICDNNSRRSLPGKGKIEIVGIEAAVRQNTKAHYIIANKLHCSELQKQLERYGVEKKNIYVCNEIALGSDLMWDFYRYCR